MGRDAGSGTPAAKRGPYRRFHVEHRQSIRLARVTGTRLANATPVTTQTRQVWSTRTRDCDPKRQAFHVEPGRTGRAVPGGQQPQSIVGCTTMTALAMARQHRIEYRDLETPCGRALAPGDHGSGETSLGEGQLIRFRDSECLFLDRQAQQRVIRRALGPSGSAEGPGSRVYQVARLCGAGVSPTRRARSGLPRSWRPARTHEPR